MKLKTVAILSPGDMGHAVGRVLDESGLDVITCLKDRSERTRQLAHKAGINDVPNLTDLVTMADLVLSILVPAHALGVARQIADAIQVAGTTTAFADCNAVSPQTTEAMERLVSDAGGRFIDGSIIGGPPKPDAPPRFYVSGQHAAVMSDLDGRGIIIRNLGDTVGRASGIKMCYAALTKGTSALQFALLAVAERLDLTDELHDELLFSQAETYRHMEAHLPTIPSKALRWVGEMEEISSTFEISGLSPHFHKGAAEMYDLISQTALTEELDGTYPTLRETISIVANTVSPDSQARGERI